MHRRVGNLSIPGLVIYVVVIGALIVGLIVQGGTGDTIAMIAGLLLAFTILGAIGVGKSARDGVDRRGRWPN